MVKSFWNSFVDTFNIDREPPCYKNLLEHTAIAAQTWVTAKAVYVINNESDKAKRRTDLTDAIQVLDTHGRTELDLDKVLQDQIQKHIRL